MDLYTQVEAEVSEIHSLPETDSSSDLAAAGQALLSAYGELCSELETEVYANLDES